MKSRVVRTVTGGLLSPRSESFQHLRTRLRHPIWMGSLRRTHPVTRWGWERGTPIDRVYIQSFIDEHGSDIKGHVLEVREATYASAYAGQVDGIHILDVDAANPRASIVADLAIADSIQSDTFDCFILTQTLQYIYDLQSAVRNVYRILRPGGVVLVTVPSIIRVDSPAPDYWRFTPASCKRLFEDYFGSAQVQGRAYGNVLSAIAFLSGLAAEEFTDEELAYYDADYPLITCVRAVKPQTTQR